MTIPTRVVDYVTQKDIDFSIVAHRPTESSLESAHAAHIDGERVAKAVLLSDHEGYLLAVLPASRDVRLDELESVVGTALKLAPEAKLADAFDDCTPGAVPALGEAYGIRTIVDSSLTDLSQVYFEAGDHEDLIRVTGDDFRRLLPNARFVHFSE